MEQHGPYIEFSLDEVNAVIQKLEDAFQNFWTFRLNAQEILQEFRKQLKNNPPFFPSEIAEQQMRYSQAHFLLEQAQKELNKILKIGGIIKDLEIGLVDFYHFLEGRDEPVFLCWKYGERRVRYWHRIHEGYVARKPLTRKDYPFL
jgi:hypothetical protein